MEEVMAQYIDPMREETVGYEPSVKSEPKASDHGPGTSESSTVIKDAILRNSSEMRVRVPAGIRTPA